MTRGDGARHRNAPRAGNLAKAEAAEAADRCSEQQHAFCSAYIRLGSASGAAVYAANHPGSGYRLVENPAIKAQIQKLREQAERREEQIAETKFAIGREFLDVHLAHQIANGETHKFRGDADRVKAIVGYKALGAIQPSRVVAQATTTVVPPQGQTVFEIYKSKWLLEKEAAMSALEQYGKRLLPGKEPKD